MVMRTRLIAVAIGIGVAGCGRIEEAAMPVADKVNAAYPVSPDVQAARDRLHGLLPKDEMPAFEAQSESRMTLRALQCSKSAAIGRFDALAQVKNLSLDRRCFQEQDKELAQFYGLRAIGALLTRPPLRPRKPAGTAAMLPRGRLSSILYGTFARDAGVAVLRDSLGDAAVVEIPGGAPIAHLQRTSGQVHEHNSRLSPNGHALAIGSALQGPVFYEAETGHRIWEAADGGRVLAWLPHVAGFLMAARDGSVLIADGQRGTLEPHPLAPKGSSFAADIPGTPARTLLGTSHELVLVEHARAGEEVRASLVKQFRIGSGHGITSGQPVPMRSGKTVVFATVRDIGWLDLDSGDSGKWKSSPYFGIPFAKLDETRILIDSVERDRLTMKHWSFDIDAETVAPVNFGGFRGLLVDIGERTGFMRRADQAWFGDELEAGDPLPLDKVAADYELQQHLAKLQAAANSEVSAADAIGRARTATDQGGAPRMPGLADVPKDAQVHMIGVYEGKRSPGAARTDRSPRSVRVDVATSSRPVVLVLASYETVEWSVVNRGTRIAAVLLSGYEPSTVSGVGNARVLRIGPAYAYSSAGPDYLRLREAVARYTGELEIRSFQGAYAGSTFSVGGY